jgi:hypothetical protein
MMALRALPLLLLAAAYSGHSSTQRLLRMQLLGGYLRQSPEPENRSGLAAILKFSRQIFLGIGPDQCQ